jgi:hypothetical protein
LGADALRPSLRHYIYITELRAIRELRCLRVPVHNAGNLGVPCPADEEMCDRDILIPGNQVYALISGLLVRE